MDELEWRKTPSGNVNVRGYKDGGNVLERSARPSELKDVVGKEIARTITESSEASGKITGKGLAGWRSWDARVL